MSIYSGDLYPPDPQPWDPRYTPDDDDDIADEIAEQIADDEATYDWWATRE